MIRRTLPGLILLAGLTTVTAYAGGWGVITVRHLPDFAEVGKPLVLSFTVRPHGREPATGLSGVVEAVSGTERVAASAVESRTRGIYEASLVLPREGQWVLTIRAGYQVTLLPIAAVDPGARPAAIDSVERGRRLFVAKGCATCHLSSLSTSQPSLKVGPEIVPQKYRPEFLARMLADPAVNIPPRPESPVRMPNLRLDQQEIASLVAFIDSGHVTASR